jgi:hypothetical protein
MESSGFSVEITLDTGGVRSVRVFGEDWGQSAEAHCLLQRLSPLIKALDAKAKKEDSRIQAQDGAAVQ